MNNETVEIPEKYKYKIKKSPYVQLFDREMPFSLSIYPMIIDTGNQQMLYLEDLIEPDNYLYYELNDEEIREKFTFVIVFSIYSKDHPEHIGRITNLFDFYDDELHGSDFIEKSTSLFMTLIGAGINECQFSSMMSRLPNIDYSQLTNSFYVKRFIEETDEGINHIFDLLNMNEEAVYDQLFTIYDSLGTLLHYYDLQTIDPEGPFYFDDNSKENEFFIQDCSMGPVWYFIKGFNLNERGQNNA